MSRIGIKPVVIPETVNIQLTTQAVAVKGPLGELIVAVPLGIKVIQQNDKLIVSRLNDDKERRSLHGTIRNRIQNAVTGVLTGFQKKLELIGIGYRAAVEDGKLSMQLGFTHPVNLEIPEGIEVKIEKNVLTIQGADRQQVGEFAAVIRRCRRPEPYKGKGVRLQGEQIRLKQGKAVKAAT